MFINNTYKVELRPTTCITPDGPKSIPTVVPYVVERVLQRFCQKSAQGPHLVPFLPSFSAYIHDRETYMDMSHSQKNKILGEMRQSLAEILQHLEVVIGPDMEGLVAYTDDHDHKTTPRITLTSYMFEALSQARTEAEVDHGLLLLVDATIHEISHIWLRVRHPSLSTPEKVKARHESRAPSGRGDGGEPKEVALFGGLLSLMEIKDANDIITRRLSIAFPSISPAPTYIIKDQSVRRILSMFLVQDVQDEMLDSPPFFTALRDVSRLYSPEYRDMVHQSTTAASTTNFPRLPILRQIPSSGAVEMAENGLVSSPLSSGLAASHSDLPSWQSFKNVFRISFSAETSPNTTPLQPPHTPCRTESTFNTIEFCRPPLPFPQARLNELGEVEYYPFGEVKMHQLRTSGGSYSAD